MSKHKDDPKLHEIRIPFANFLASYNENIPDAFPRASVALLKQFKEEHPSLFKSDNLWSLDLHRKKLIDWLARIEMI